MMTPERLDQLKDDYAWMIVDGMDMKTLCQFAAENIVENMKDWDYNDMKEDITDMCGEEVWEDLIE
jgi:hypothetical protein